MKPIYFLLILLLSSSCVEQKDAPQNSEIKSPSKSEIRRVVDSNFQKIIDDANVNGVLLIYDPQTRTYTSNDFDRAEKKFSPASTYKIPNSIIALETGVVEDENTMFKWDGKKRFFKMWEQDFVFSEAYKKSCLPCYQEIARDIGVERMKEYVSKIGYPNMDIDSSNIDIFWLKGNSKISAIEQVQFLERLYNSELPISERTEKTMKKIMIIDEKLDYQLSGKTGWVMDDDYNLGWFVGFVQQKGKVYFMATNIDPKENFDMKLFPRIRLQLLKRALKQQGIGVS